MNAPAQSKTLGQSIRGPATAGIIVLAVFVAIFFGWGATAPLAGGAIASGRISPEGSSRIVQHLEGGIIEEFVVEDGHRVEAGEPLIVLRSTQARAGYQVLLGQKRLLGAQIGRLRSEQAGLSAPKFADWLEADRNTVTSVREILESQAELFERRTVLAENRKSVLLQRIAQLREEIVGLENQIEAQDRRAVLTATEASDIAELVEKELAPRPRLLALQREEASIEEQRAVAVSSIARAEQAIGEAQVQLLAMDAERLDNIVSELNAVQAEFAEIEERLRASQDVLDRTVVTAPIGGIVTNSRFKTEGGVIGPGAPILDIVPEDEALIIEARLSPLDVDQVQPGQVATVYLSALSQRELPRIEGAVLDVSPDALTDEITGEPYFRLRVRVEPSLLRKIGAADQLTAGMPAEVVVLTGERTMLDYLIAPIRDSMRRAMRET